MSAGLSAMRETNAEKTVLRWLNDPVEFVADNFRDPCGGPATPDQWQADALRAVPKYRRVVMHACKGPGKSTVLAWIGWWILSLFKQAQGFATSITEANLKDNLWKELDFWYGQSEFLRSQFDVFKTAIRSSLTDFAGTWFLTQKAFPQEADDKQQANSLAGLHGPTPFCLLDEVGDYPLGVIHSAEGIFATNAQNAMIAAAGNPTNRKKALFHLVTKAAEKWFAIPITGDPEDPKRSPRVSLEYAEGLIAELGRDHPFVKVNVLGEFPPGDEDQLIDINVIRRAQRRDARVEIWRPHPFVWGLDPGRSPLGDESALCRRRGVKTFEFKGWRGLNGVQLGQKIARLINKSEDAGQLVDCVFIDVGGIGASAYDHLVFLKFKQVKAIDFGAAADDPSRFADKRSEMWWEMAQWLAHGGPADLPPDPTLEGELQSPAYTYDVRHRHTVFILESKKDMKRQGKASPNRADALALTFAGPVAKRVMSHAELLDKVHGPQVRVATDYDPFGDQVQAPRAPTVTTYYDPLAD